MSTRFMVAAVLIFGSVSMISAAQAQGVGLHRTDLVKQDLSAAGRQAVQVRVDFEPGAVSIKHAHPGEEIAYVLEGSLEYQLEGRQPITLGAGEALFIPAGVAHVAKNVSNSKASELATYVVETGKPLVKPIK